MTTTAISKAFTVDKGEDGQPHRVHNVIGYLPGTNPAYKDQAVLITAHYDHLGRGWPNARQQDVGQIHPGADDNASGVAVLIELARNFAAGAPPERNLVFVAFSAEEAGLLGSRHYAEHPRPAPLEGIVGVINLDSVGRLEDQPISVLATGSAMEWPFVFRGVSAVTGIPSENIAGALASSDQKSFIDRGVPGVQIFTGAHLDYHRPSDTPDKVNAAGMVKVATFVNEATGYLIGREEPMALSGSATAALARQPAGQHRRTAPRAIRHRPGLRPHRRRRARGVGSARLARRAGRNTGRGRTTGNERRDSSRPRRLFRLPQNPGAGRHRHRESTARYANDQDRRYVGAALRRRLASIGSGPSRAC